MVLAERYRPLSLDLIVGQEHVVKALKSLIEIPEKVPHFLFSGPPGCGKTSMAYAWASEVKYSVVEYNASDERGIGTIRDKVKRLAFTSGKRIILLDEADQLTPEAQHALRRILERCGKEVKFIFTCNEDWKIIDPIKSRCAIFYFKKLKGSEVFRIIWMVLKAEGVAMNKGMRKALVTLIDYVDGDARKALNLLESIILRGDEVTEANIRLLIPPEFGKEVLEVALEGKWEEALRKLEDMYIRAKLDTPVVIRQLYDGVKNLNEEQYVKVKLFEKLADVERNIKIGCNPLIQLSSFISTAWVAKFVPKGSN